MESHFNLKISNQLQFRIYKPLVTLKISLLLWNTAGSALITYLTLFLKQKGLTIEEISLIYLTANLATTYDLQSLDEKDLHCAEAKFLHFGSNLTCENIYLPENCRKFCKKNNTDFEYCQLDFNYEILQSQIDGTVSFLNYFNETRSDIKLCSSNFTKMVLVGNDYNSLCEAYDKVCEKSCSKYRFPHENRLRYVLLYSLVIILLLTAHENMFRFVDVLTLAMIRFQNAEYGKQKIWGTIGSLLGPSLAALVLYLTNVSEQDTNYIFILYLYAFLAVVTLIAVITLDVKRQESVKKMFKSATILFKKLDFLLFTFVLLVLGATWGFQVSFKNVYLVDVGTSTYLIGLIDTFAAVCGLPVLFTSKWLTEKIGNTNIFVLALLCHGLKCIGYSYLTEAWLAFLLELTSAINFHLVWVAVMEYCNEISRYLKATVIAFAGAVHFSLGRASGSAIGGLLMSTYGGSTAFQVMAAVCGVTALFYSVYLYNKHVKMKRSLSKY
ncbi:Major facilitator superfamily like protein [Argiope bruennichi]|uniref:Major facilitator superfamily like protein n=1 Tax=Argiope bruennichi TaxID=94029 RepID=A0A8T0E6D1_ARGBR|nr:Major facilitator superfamily like protein [Argiope bruennichi]